MPLRGLLEGHVIVSLGGREVLLRPTIRVAIMLMASPGGIVGCATRVSEYDLDECVAVIIQAGYLKWSTTTREQIWASGLEKVGPKVLHFLLMLSNGGFDPDDHPELKVATHSYRKASAAGTALTLEAYCEWLFNIGTGWIGWSDEQTLDTPMQHIVRARAGRIEMLKAIFGDGREEARTVSATNSAGIKELMQSFSGKGR